MLNKDDSADIVGAEREKEAKEIAERLAKFKLDKQDSPEDTLASMMPSRAKDAEIKMPEPPKRFKKPAEAGSESNESMFGGMGISKRSLKKKLMFDPEVKKIARTMRLGLNPSERAELVKNVFTNRMGTNISEQDMERATRMLNRKFKSAEPSSEEHAKFRKELKFLKKLKDL